MSVAYTPRGRFVVYDKTFGWEDGRARISLLRQLHQRRRSDSWIPQRTGTAGESWLYSDTDVRGS